MGNKWVSVKDAFDREYKRTGFVPTSNMSHDPNSKTYIENNARKRAFAGLDWSDKRQVDGCVKRLKECCVGVSLGDAAALQILEHIGIFLNEAEKA